MMAAAQPFISGAISKTINMPHAATVDDVRNAYLAVVAADAQGQRALPRRLQAEPAAQHRADDDDPDDDAERRRRRAPDQPSASPRRSSTATSPTPPAARPPRRLHAEGARSAATRSTCAPANTRTARSGEIFIDMHKEGAAFRSMMNCFAIAVSLGLQYGVPLEEFVDAFVFTRFEPNGVVKGNPTTSRCPRRSSTTSSASWRSPTSAATTWPMCRGRGGGSTGGGPTPGTGGPRRPAGRGGASRQPLRRGEQFLVLNGPGGGGMRQPGGAVAAAGPTAVEVARLALAPPRRGWRVGSESASSSPLVSPSRRSSRATRAMPVRNAATSPWSATGRASNARPAAAPPVAVEHAWRSVQRTQRGPTVGSLTANHRRQLWLLRKRLRRRRLLRRRSSKKERA